MAWCLWVFHPSPRCRARSALACAWRPPKRCRLPPCRPETLEACSEPPESPGPREQGQTRTSADLPLSNESAPTGEAEASDGNGHELSFMRSTGVDDLDARFIAEDPSFAELEKAARAWIGDSLDRWLWWERQKARRYRLLQQIKQQEELVAVELAELEQSLGELQSLTGLRFLSEDGKISGLGWVLIAMILLIPCGLIFVSIHLVQQALSNQV
jgi:hypothetical protein